MFQCYKTSITCFHAFSSTLKLRLFLKKIFFANISTCIAIASILFGYVDYDNYKMLQKTACDKAVFYG